MKYMNKLILISLTALLIFTVTACDSSSDDIPSGYNNLNNLIDEGYQLYQQGDFENALLRFSNALERDVDPANAIRAYQGLGWTYARVGQPAKAVNNFNFLLSAENLRTGLDPIIEKEGIEAELDSILQTPSFMDTAGVGKYVIKVTGSDFILSVASISSYAGKTSERLTIGETSNLIAKGTDEIALLNSPVSNIAGTAEAAPLDADVSFSIAQNAEKDSFTVKVDDPANISELYHYYVDAAAGVVHIKPRLWDMSKLQVFYRFYSNQYAAKYLRENTISLEDVLLDGSSLPQHSGGDVFYVEAEVYDAASGGSYYQADAFAGLASTYFTMGEYALAVKSCHTVLLINDFLETYNDPDYPELSAFPYQRQLFSGDDEISLWDIYDLLALSYFKLHDYANAEMILENYMYGTEVANADQDDYEVLLLTKLIEGAQPAGWTAPDYN